MIFTRAILLRARVTLLFVLLSMVIIGFKIADLQLLNGEKWRNYAHVSQLEYRPIIASRGNIYSDDQSLLATSLPFYTVALDPTVVSDVHFTQEVDLLSQKLSDFYGDYSPQHYKSKITHAREKKKRYLLLHSKLITHEERKQMLQWPIFKWGRFKGGVVFTEQYERYNPFKTLAKRTIGTYKEIHGSGLEYAFDHVLKGIDGQALYQKFVGGNWKQVKEHIMIRPVHGCDVETTIDINMQDVMHSSLLAVLEKTSAQRGCAVIMEVATGAVKAIANLSRTLSGQYLESYNYALGNQGVVEPGSIFKLISMLALLEETKWPLSKLVETGNGALLFHNRWMTDVRKGGYGLITLQEVFEKSSNVGVSMLVNQVFESCPEKFIAYMEQLNLHQPLKIELVGEGIPYVITPKSKMWNKLTLPWLSIGYNLHVTPLQMLTIYNAVANNGKMVKPMFVRHIKSADHIVETFSTTVLKDKICSDETLYKLKVMLEGTVERGLAKHIKHAFYRIAGKTGTAQKVINGKYTNNHLTSFVGYFPVDKPRYSCIIVVDSPQGNKFRFGSEVPAPIFKDIVDRIAGKDLQARSFLHESMPLQPPVAHVSSVGKLKTLCYLYQWLNLPTGDWSHSLNDVQAWGALSLHSTFPSVQPYALPSVERVPSVLNMKLRDALFLLEERGLKVTIGGTIHGIVHKQSLAPSTVIPDDKQITIILK